MKKNLFGKFFTQIVMTLALWLGASGAVMMAAGTLATDSGSSGESSDPNSGMNAGVQGDNGRGDGGSASVTDGQQNNPDLYETDLEQTIYKLDPYNTVLLTLMGDSKSRKINSQEFEFYSVGPRILRSTVVGEVVAGTDRHIIKFADKGFCGKDDTLRFVGIHGYDYKTGAETVADLMCIVVDKDTTGAVAIYPKNGVDAHAGGFEMPEIPEGTVVIRMGKSCSESKAQTARANAAPSSEKGCVQNFMLQIEQTEFDRMTDKRVPWSFDDIVDWNMRDYKITKELTYWFGVGGLDRHPANYMENNYTMQGIWWQAGRDLEIGHVVTDEQGNVVYEIGADGSQATLQGGTYKYDDGSIAIAKVEIDGTDLVRFSKAAFIGNGGSQTKNLIAGANVVEAFDNIKGKQYEHKDIVTENDLTVQNFKTSFGVIKLTYNKLFDICGMANAGFLLDKPYLRSVEFMSLNKTVLKLKETGQRNSHGVVLQEVNAVYLQYADCHARVWLADRVDLYDFTVAAKYDHANQRTVSPSKNEPYKGGKPANMHYCDRQAIDMAAREERDA